jgi:anti-sigma factor (TIGR02949 family)
MDCKTALSLLEAYLDNELDRSEARELEAHVDSCAECRAELNRLDELRRALRDASLRYTAPQSLRERIRAAPVPQSTRYALPAWPQLAAACVLAFAAGGISVHMWTTTQSAGAQTQLTRDLFASHWRALAAASPVDVVSTDRHTVKPWFAGKIAEAPLVQDFAEQGFALAGGRIDYVGSERVAVLVYRHGQHLIDVFVLPPSDAAALGKPMPLRGYTLDTITLGDQPAAIVTDMDASERARFAELLSSKQ